MWVNNGPKPRNWPDRNMRRLSVCLNQEINNGHTANLENPPPKRPIKYNPLCFQQKQDVWPEGPGLMISSIHPQGTRVVWKKCGNSKALQLKQGLATVALPFTLNKNYGNSNISKCKDIIFKKSSKRKPKSCKIL